MSQRRTVFFISDRTGITAEMLGNSLLTQFEDIVFHRVTIPFVDSMEKAADAVRQVYDDGAATRDLNKAQVILVGVSRCGKTPTSLYLALQFGIRAANFPLTPDDFSEHRLPASIVPHREK